MRRLLSVTAASLAVTLFAHPATAQTTEFKFAFADSRQLIEGAPGAAEAQATFQREVEGYENELAQLENELNGLIAEYERQQVVLSPEARERQQQTIQQKQQEYTVRYQQLEQQVARRQAELLQPIMQRVEQAVEEFRRANGYAAIFDLSAGIFIAADPSLDVTQQILTILRNTASHQP